jgi:hypothetical protein
MLGIRGDEDEQPARRRESSMIAMAIRIMRM